VKVNRSGSIKVPRARLFDHNVTPRCCGWYRILADETSGAHART
jgi:hypothetical protein